MRSNDDDDSGSDDFADSDDSSDESLSEASRERRFEWRREENVPKQFRFSGHPGVNCDRLHRESSPFKAYSCFITSEVMDLLVKETNRYVFFFLYVSCIDSLELSVGNAFIVYMSGIFFPGASASARRRPRRRT